MKLISKLLVATIVVFAAMSVNAGWLCKAHNARGEIFYGKSGSHFMADAEALKNCAMSSKDCTIDSCGRGVEEPVQPLAVTWQCNEVNGRGQVWTGTGPNRDIAASNATGFCAAHSARVSSCKIQSCFIKKA